MTEKPRDPDEPLFDKSLFIEIIVSGIIIGSIVFLTWYYLINVLNMNIEIARGYIMALMVFIQNIHVFNCRSEKNSAFSVPINSNKLIFVGVLCSIILQIIVMEIPFLSAFLKTISIPFSHLIYLFLLASLVLILIEIYKIIMKYAKETEKNN